MRVDIGEPRLDLGDLVRVGLCLGCNEEIGALAVAGQYGIDQSFGAAGRFLRDGADLGPARHPDRAGFRADFAQDDSQKR